MSGRTSAHKLSSIDPASCSVRGSIDRRGCVPYTYVQGIGKVFEKKNVFTRDLKPAVADESVKGEEHGKRGLGRFTLLPRRTPRISPRFCLCLFRLGCLRTSRGTGEISCNLEKHAFPFVGTGPLRNAGLAFRSSRGKKFWSKIILSRNSDE